MDFFEEEDDYDDDRPRRGKLAVFRNIRTRISGVGKTKRRRSGDEEEEEDDDDDDEYGGFSKKKTNKTKTTKKKPTKPKRDRSHSLHQGGLKRSAAARVLRRMSLSPASSKIEGEEDDVPMPLPGDGTVASSDTKRSLNKRKNLAKIKKALVKGNPNQDNTGSSHSRGTRSKSAGSISRRSKTNNKKPTKRGRRRKSNGSDRSSDSPPSVALTENSVDIAPRTGRAIPHQHAQMKLQAQEFQRLQKTNSNNAFNNGLPRFFNRERDPEDENGLIRESMSMDYYYQSIPWIIKTWIYFLTVVVPFTLLYYCFVGIFHSTTLAQNPLLKKVAISNTLFAGLGCTFRSGFFARQTWDAKGIYSKGVVAPLPATSRITPKRPPRRNRSRSVSFNKDTNTSKVAFLRPPAVSLRNRTKRLQSKSVLTPSGRIFPSNNNTTSSILGSLSDRGTSSRRPAGITHTPNTTLSNQSAPAPPNNARRGGGGGGGVWDDVETILPKRNENSKRTSRGPLMKDKSIMEIYELHASDEKVGIQFG